MGAALFAAKTDMSGGTPKLSVAQKIAFQNWISMVGTTTSMTLMIAAMLNNDDDDETEVVLDPRSSDFMKIRLGNTRIDPFGGRLQMITFQARMWSGEYANERGKVNPIGVKGTRPFTDTKTRGQLIYELARNKFSPSAGLTADFMTSKKKNRIEEPTEAYEVTPTNEVTSEELHPVLIQLIEKGLKEIEEGKTFTNEEVMRMTKEKYPFLK
jgi:hypothetical protein